MLFLCVCGGGSTVDPRPANKKQILMLCSLLVSELLSTLRESPWFHFYQVASKRGSWDQVMIKQPKANAHLTRDYAQPQIVVKIVSMCSNFWFVNLGFPSV